MLVEANVAGDVAKSLVPVATFLVGYGLSYWDRIRDQKRQRRNLRTILFQELADNYQKVNRLAGAEIKDPSLSAEVFHNLSRQVYDAYLSKLDGLNESELAAVLDLYSTMSSGVLKSNEFANALSAQPDVKAELGEIVTGLFAMLDTKMTTAVRAFPRGDALIEECADERAKAGREIDKFLCAHADD